MTKPLRVVKQVFFPSASDTWQRIRPGKQSDRTAVLVAAHTAPLPPVSGGAIYIANALLPFAEQYALHLLLVGDEKMLEHLHEHISLYDQYFHSVTFVHKEYPGKNFVSRVAYFMERILRGLPFLDINYYSRHAVGAAREVIAKFSISFMELHSTHLAYLKHYFPSMPSLLVSHNIESELFPFWLNEKSSIAEKVVAFFSRRNARRVEIENIWHMDVMTFISQGDMEKVTAPVRKFHLPLTFPKTGALRKNGNGGACHILWLGGFWWWPNTEGMEWFVRDVLPRIRDRLENLGIVLDIVGGNPTPAILAAHDGQAVCVHGFVDDLSQFLIQADLLMVPLLSGGGVRVKIVEAMSQGIPVLSTSKGCEGLGCVHGESIWIADTAENFASAIVELARGRELRLSLRECALRHIDRFHNHDKAIALKESIYWELERKLIGTEPIWLTCKRYIKKIPDSYALLSYLRSRTKSPYDGLTYLKPIECLVIDKHYTNISSDSFSVVIPVKNEAEGIVSFLNSLAAQSVSPKEYIIIDHDSADGTANIIAEENKRLSLPIRLLSARDHYKDGQTTLAQDRNIAVRASTTENILFTDAGTRLAPEFLGNLIGPLLEHPDADLSGAIFHTTDPALEHKFVYAWDSGYMCWQDFLPSCRGMAIRHQLFEKAGGLPEFLTFAGEDTLFDITYRRLSRKWIFNRQAIVYWDAPADEESTWRKFYNYGIGDGESGVGDFQFYASARSVHLASADIVNQLPDTHKAMFYGYLAGKTRRARIDRECRGVRKTVLFAMERHFVFSPSSLEIIKNLIDGNNRVIGVICNEITHFGVGKLFLDFDISLLELAYLSHFDLERFFVDYASIDSQYVCNVMEDVDNSGVRSKAFVQMLHNSGWRFHEYNQLH